MKTHTMYSLGLAATFLVNGVARAEVSQNILAHPGFESYNYYDAWRGSNVARRSSFETTGIGGIVIKPYDGSYLAGNDNNTTHAELSQSGNITDYLGTGGTRIYAGVFTTSNKKTGTECQLTVTTMPPIKSSAKIPPGR